MNGYMMDRVMKDIIRVVEPSQDDWKARFQIMNELRDVVQSIESLRGSAYVLPVLFVLQPYIQSYHRKGC